MRVPSLQGGLVCERCTGVAKDDDGECICVCVCRMAGCDQREQLKGEESRSAASLREQGAPLGGGGTQGRARKASGGVEREVVNAKTRLTTGRAWWGKGDGGVCGFGEERSVFIGEEHDE